MNLLLNKKLSELAFRLRQFFSYALVFLKFSLSFYLLKINFAAP